jgi:hypothetical protein
MWFNMGKNLLLSKMAFFNGRTLPRLKKYPLPQARAITLRVVIYDNEKGFFVIIRIMQDISRHISIIILYLF